MKIDPVHFDLKRMNLEREWAVSLTRRRPVRAAEDSLNGGWKNLDVADLPGSSAA